MATRKKAQGVAVGDSAPAQQLPDGDSVQTVKHRARRENIPPAGIEAQGRVEESPRIRHHYSPHLSPVLRSSNQPAETDRLPELLRTARQRALSEDEAQLLATALRRHEPWLEWSGKRERPWFEVDPVALHIHERVSTQAMLRVLAREDVNRDLFADPQQSYAEAVQFYRHDVDWSNRMILGDSLAVMASLARREDLAGKVQMVYIDPPYGISFKSNFQPQLGQRDVKDKAQDLTREPEMVKAYRDTWRLGVHSYLAYLRDRLAMARELLTDSGSIFVQISDENLHRVRSVMDEVFGSENFCSIIAFRKTTGQSGDLLPDTNDYLIWFARDKKQVRFRNMFAPREGGGWVNYTFARMSDGQHRKLSKLEFESHSLAGPDALVYRRSPATATSSSVTTLVPISFCGKTYVPGKGGWKTNAEGFSRLGSAERLEAYGETLSYRRFTDDFPLFARSNAWLDTASGGYGDEKVGSSGLSVGDLRPI